MYSVNLKECSVFTGVLPLFKMAYCAVLYFRGENAGHFLKSFYYVDLVLKQHFLLLSMLKQLCGLIIL